MGGIGNTEGQHSYEKMSKLPLRAQIPLWPLSLPEWEAWDADAGRLGGTSAHPRQHSSHLEKQECLRGSKKAKGAQHTEKPALQTAQPIKGTH